MLSLLMGSAGTASRALLIVTKFKVTGISLRPQPRQSLLVAWDVPGSAHLTGALGT